MEFKILWEGVIFYVPYRGLQETGNLFSLSFKSEIFDDATYEAGMVFYETDSYYSRIYLFLIDIPGSMYTRPFYGEGKDFYVLVKARILDKLRIYGKIEVEVKEEKNDRILKVGVEWR